ncbi:MAG: phage Gp37/Gp68 family protein [Mesorhizobium sp.]|uniref:DUF5131 family protein n=1 Tax=Mesorhizobium sp. TaxID=1871066 RepID=UPI000FE85CBD|nr:phage Gp37/Gp68 family protein [Mesorhizobium sp.]RWP88327.1 MAG: phage Gp37/Gp68 family protein [Mesorhizobium sp.]
MADKSAIEWTDATWNPVVGCTIVSPGCTHCYAMGMAARIEAMTAALQAKGQTGAPHYNGTTRKVNGNTVWTGKLAMAPNHIVLEPLTWRTPRRIFVNSMGDLFHEDVPDDWIDQVFAVMALAPQHTFQVLTKRAKRMREYLTDPAVVRRVYKLVCEMTVELELFVALIAAREHEQKAPPAPRIYLDLWPLPNVWLGVSAERQQEADERVPSLLFAPAAVRFISAEPLLGEINFRRISLGISAGTFIDHPEIREAEFTIDALTGAPRSGIPGLDLIIAGGESGPKARPMHPDAPRKIREDCAATGKAFFFKQWGAWGRAAPRPSGTPGKFAFANAGPHSDFWPAMVTPIDHYPRMIDLFGGSTVLEYVGKKAAGRLLDGVEHNAMPELPEVPAL